MRFLQDIVLNSFLESLVEGFQEFLEGVLADQGIRKFEEVKGLRNRQGK